MYLIAAVDEAWALGRQGKLLFSIPADLAHFRALTMGHAIVYGRRTLDTFPGGRPLPGRTNYILSRDSELSVPPAIPVSSPEALTWLLREETDCFVVGGASVYDLLLPRCSRAYLTKIQAVGGGDCFLPNLDEDSAWRLESQSEPQTWQGISFTFCTYVRR